MICDTTTQNPVGLNTGINQVVRARSVQNLTGYPDQPTLAAGTIVSFLTTATAAFESTRGFSGPLDGVSMVTAALVGTQSTGQDARVFGVALNAPSEDKSEVDVLVKGVAVYPNVGVTGLAFGSKLGLRANGQLGVAAANDIILGYCQGLDGTAAAAVLFDGVQGFGVKG